MKNNLKITIAIFSLLLMGIYRGYPINSSKIAAEVILPKVAIDSHVYSAAYIEGAKDMGRENYCKDCGARIGKGSLRCRSCSKKGNQANKGRKHSKETRKKSRSFKK